MSFNPLNFGRMYLIWSVACVVTGWILSAGHFLTIAGYLIGLPLMIAGFAWLLRDKNPAVPRTPAPDKKWLQILSARFSRPLPCVFLLATVFVFVGGLIYAPNNFDALTYRLPRMLHWLAVEHWTWIPTSNERMNYSGVGMEWMTMPLFMLHSDRLLFLINGLGFLLMPGLLFSVFRQMGVARPVAWSWMWILPLAYGYAMQAGSIGNDFLGAVFCLMSVSYGLRARRTGRVEDVWLAGLAAALMTGVKASNLPLLLPCLVAVWPALNCLRRRWAVGIIVGIVGIVVSAVPMALENQVHTGNWTGDPQNLDHLQIKKASGGLLGNGIILLQQSLLPPVLPGARKLEASFNQHLPAALQQELAENFPRYSLYQLNELPQEEAAGLGLGISLLLLVSLGAAIGSFFIPKTRLRHGPSSLVRIIGLAAWVAAGVYVVKMGSEATARLMLPYYPLMIAGILLLPGQAWLARCRLWKILAVMAALAVLPGLILTPSRPLWPVQTLSPWLARHFPNNPAVQRITSVYACYRNRNDLLAPLRARLPADTKYVGIVAGGNDSVYALWRPLSRRQVVDLLNESRQLVPVPANVQWLVIKNDAWPQPSGLPLEQWAATNQAEIVASVSIVSSWNIGPQTWSVLHLQPPPR